MLKNNQFIQVEVLEKDEDDKGNIIESFSQNVTEIYNKKKKDYEKYVDGYDFDTEGKNTEF